MDVGVPTHEDFKHAHALTHQNDVFLPYMCDVPRSEQSLRKLNLMWRTIESFAKMNYLAETKSILETMAVSSGILPSSSKLSLCQATPLQLTTSAQRNREIPYKAGIYRSISPSRLPRPLGDVIIGNADQMDKTKGCPASPGECSARRPSSSRTALAAPTGSFASTGIIATVETPAVRMARI